MPNVSKCVVNGCAYNCGECCHAKAITIGDNLNPGCDTFFTAERHMKHSTFLAGVGACKVSVCKYNEDFECTADSINVGYVGKEVKCLSFAAR